MHSGVISPFIRPGATHSGRILCLAFLFLFLGLAQAYGKAAAFSLAIEDAEGRPLYSVPVENGDTFAIRYRHSVALTPVTDYFVVRDNEIWLDKTVYQDFGAGLPHAPAPGQKLTREKGNLILSGFNQKLGSFQLRVGRVADHTLLLLPDKPAPDARAEWRQIPLDQLAEPGSAVTFAVRRDPE